ncbi:MAG: BolA/IbaG family iron-sulfur metabolism protein [Alphaproteobacteria bacterium]|jgi:stress-induced morphogen|tara:strand:- start:3741 stop:3998 length:258 start_codon:yes stop_codon:yes gene_type:complete
MLLQEIKKNLDTITEFNINGVYDKSVDHQGHTSVLGLESQLTHIEVNVSLGKNKITRMDIHRRIYSELQLFIDGGLHSISIKISK